MFCLAEARARLILATKLAPRLSLRLRLMLCLFAFVPLGGGGCDDIFPPRPARLLIGGAGGVGRCWRLPRWAAKWWHPSRRRR